MQKNLPFSSISILDKENYVSEEETSESEEEEPNLLFNNFLNNFTLIDEKTNKVSRCKSFCRKMKKGYGFTKNKKLFNFAGWKCWSKEGKNELTTEKVLPKLDKEKSFVRK